jgi:inner membrane protein involved in colicin E2 resistance
MNSPFRIAAIVFIFIASSIAWQVLGAVTSHRSHQQEKKLGGEVSSLWGKSQTQTGPAFRFQWETKREEEQVEEGDGKKKTLRKNVTETHQRGVEPEATTLRADLKLDQRLRGLVWYSLYGVTFDGQWRYRHQQPEAGKLFIDFTFPVASAIYDDFRFVVNGKDLGPALKVAEGGVNAEIAVQPGQLIELQVHYVSRGMDDWRYQPQSKGVANLRNFKMVVTSNFTEIDYPADSLSPSSRQRAGTGWELTWTFAQVLTGQAMGLVMPARIQPGDLASELAHSAPISLMFFFLVIFVIAVLRRLDIHPINYLCLAGAFFAFHLLFAYSVDHLSVGVAFALASVVSLVLVASYLRLVVSPAFAYREAALCQLVYQVGFAAAHFLPGYTGLTITVLAILTLFILMQLTGRVRWSDALARAPRPTL